MTTPISEYVTVNVTVADRLLQTQGFGTPLLFHLATLPATWDTGQRTASYTSLASVTVDWATTTKVYRAAQALFTGTRAPAIFKVGREDAADSGVLATALDAIVAEDPDFYGIISSHRLEADVNAIAAWVSSAATRHIYIPGSELSGVPDSGDSSDIASDFQTAGYVRSGVMYHHNGGVDVTGAAYVIADGVATVTETAHGIRVGDSVVFSSSSGASIDGTNTVATVPTANTFTVTTTAADEAGPDTVDYYARYDFPEVRWVGFMLPTEPGEEDWAFKELTGQVPTPLSLLTLTQQQTVKSKNANIYTSIGGLGATQIGTMGSGRFIDTQIGIDWIEARLGEALMQRRINSPKIPYTQAGINSLIPDMVGVIELGASNGLLSVIATSTSGEIYQIVMPQLINISQADKIARNLPAAEVTVQFAGSIVTFNIDVAALI